MENPQNKLFHRDQYFFDIIQSFRKTFTQANGTKSSKKEIYFLIINLNPEKKHARSDQIHRVVKIIRIKLG